MTAEAKLEELKKIVDHQAGMETFWCINVGISEAMLQAALRHLHAVIEDAPNVAEESKQIYWNLESEL